jgi:hypothetical protein
MAQIEWHGEQLDVRRLVIDVSTPEWLKATLRALALELALGYTTLNVSPRPGDLWFARTPEYAPIENPPPQTGWVQTDEVFQAIARLGNAQASAYEAERAEYLVQI